MKALLQSRSWADRMKDPFMEVVDYATLPNLPRDSEEEVEGSQLVEVSESTKNFLQLKCTRSVPNDKRRRVKAQYL